MDAAKVVRACVRLRQPSESNPDSDLNLNCDTQLHSGHRAREALAMICVKGRLFHIFGGNSHEIRLNYFVEKLFRKSDS
jgi:hypothetical protein